MEYKTSQKYNSGYPGKATITKQTFPKPKEEQMRNK